MKIALLTQSYPPMISGAALFVERLANHLAAQGHQILVMAASDLSEPYQICKQNLEIERFRSYRNPFRVGQRFAFWPQRRIIQRLAEFKPDLIHIHDPFQLGLAGLAFGKDHNVPVLLTIHQLPWFVSAYMPVGRSLQRQIERLLWRYAVWVLRRCSGAAVATQTIAGLIADQTGIKPQVISYGVDLDAFSSLALSAASEAVLRSRLGIPLEAPVILHVGRLDKDKLVERVVRSAAIAMQHMPGHLVVVGDGTERVKLEHLCTQLGIGERCHFPGFVSIEQGLAEYYALADVFVTASEVETQGLVLLEAAACAVPIVAVQATCLHEIVHEGLNGYLLPSGDLNGMANRLAELAQDLERARQMGAAGRLIVERHAEAKTFSAYLDLYRELGSASGVTVSQPAAGPNPAGHFSEFG